MIVLFVLLKINKLARTWLNRVTELTFTLHQQRTVSGEFAGRVRAQRFSDRSEIDWERKAYEAWLWDLQVEQRRKSVLVIWRFWVEGRHSMDKIYSRIINRLISPKSSRRGEVPRRMGVEYWEFFFSERPRANRVQILSSKSWVLSLERIAERAKSSRLDSPHPFE